MSAVPTKRGRRRRGRRGESPAIRSSILPRLSCFLIHKGKGGEGEKQKEKGRELNLMLTRPRKRKRREDRRV